ncbi:hypothetical protein [Streptomyces sp. NPDC059063]|uniref:hypothetical protein n=1 Tax=unclassified Streptomyces TaxID=2593676 RepID=UPI003692D5A0
MIKRVAVGVAAAALCVFGGSAAVADTGGNATARPAGSSPAASTGQGSATGSGITPDAWELRLDKHTVTTSGWFDKHREDVL